MRLVLDTNSVISGLLWDNAPSKLLDLALEERVQLFSTRTLLLELADVLPRAKFARRVAAAGIGAEGLIARYAVLAQIVEPAVISPTSSEPDDDHVLAGALGADADMIVSGDADLLNLKQFHRIAIMTPAEALARIRQQERSRDER